MDYCTLWFEGWWAHCCKAHDAAYAAQSGRGDADFELLKCVAQSLPSFVADNPLLAGGFVLASGVIGVGMWAGVRLFGGRFYRKA